MKLLYSLLLIFISYGHAFAGNAVLLTSFKVSKPVQMYLTAKFKRSFSKTGLNVIAQHNVTPEILHSTLTNPETEILIWISHAGAENHFDNGLATKGVILDVHGNDVKNFFTSPNKNLKFIGIVGCSARSIIDGFVARGNYENRPGLEIKSYHEKVKLYKGFKETINESLNHLGKDTSRNFDYEKDLEINVSISKAPVASSWLEVGDKVLAVIGKNSSKNLEIRISKEEWDEIKTKNIKHLRAKEESDPLPDLEFTSNLGNWKVFSTKDGTVIGGNDKHLYIYKK